MQYQPSIKLLTSKNLDISLLRWNCLNLLWAKILELYKLSWTSPFAQSFMPWNCPYPNCQSNTTINYGKNICQNGCKILKVYASKKTIRSCKNFVDFQPFQPCITLPLNFLSYFSCVVVVGFPWYIYFSKWLEWGKLHNDIDLPLFAILLELLACHSLPERRNIFVIWWLKLSHVHVVLQIAWVRTSPQLRWITWFGLALYLALDRVSGYLWHHSKWFLPVRPFPAVYVRA